MAGPRYREDVDRAVEGLLEAALQFRHADEGGLLRSAPLPWYFILAREDYQMHPRALQEAQRRIDWAEEQLMRQMIAQQLAAPEDDTLTLPSRNYIETNLEHLALTRHFFPEYAERNRLPSPTRYGFRKESYLKDGLWHAHVLPFAYYRS